MIPRTLYPVRSPAALTDHRQSDALVSGRAVPEVDPASVLSGVSSAYRRQPQHRRSRGVLDERGSNVRAAVTQLGALRERAVIAPVKTVRGRGGRREGRSVQQGRSGGWGTGR